MQLFIAQNASMIVLAVLWLAMTGVVDPVNQSTSFVTVSMHLHAASLYNSPTADSRSDATVLQQLPVQTLCRYLQSPGGMRQCSNVT